MVDNLEVQSTASSEISESLREQILGRAYRRKSVKPTKTTKSEVIVPSKESMNVKNQTDGKKSGGDNNNKEGSYHTVLSHSKHSSFVVIPNSGEKEESARKGRSFVVLSRQPSHKSMKASSGNYTTIQTQTVAIQTVATGTEPDLECKCSWGDYECGCPECEPQGCRYSYSKKRTTVPSVPEESSDPSVSLEHTDTSSQTVDISRRYRNRCTCSCRSWDYDSCTDQLSDSDESYSTDFFDLPYQNNEEYLQLLRELEKKLLLRNKERVRRTMMEFERKSRQNQNLDKPVCDYNCEDTASMLHKLATKRIKNNRNGVCCNCGKNKRVNSDILQNEKRWDEINYVQSVLPNEPKCSPRNRIERSLHKSHWRLDPRSGEWVKVACFKQTDFCKGLRGDYLPDEHLKGPPSSKNHKKECRCCQKQRR